MAYTYESYDVAVVEPDMRAVRLPLPAPGLECPPYVLL